MKQDRVHGSRVEAIDFQTKRIRSFELIFDAVNLVTDAIAELPNLVGVRVDKRKVFPIGRSERFVPGCMSETRLNLLRDALTRNDRTSPRPKGGH
jgi:hypothetical protein